ncbi:hypothetical protein LLE49_14495 [Alicyclobacillus tolerans]|uniref:hypothetical protein n=1 Tax=Alicyclobacillus tolerans TaxID=90970 RepID=UPI001F38A2E9|nr:hypothetical protein [Alicyclobacillus tolerans]MCF8565932.1 hypothetical protein [Alicyclobacillus tolerans]
MDGFSLPQMECLGLCDKGVSHDWVSVQDATKVLTGFKVPSVPKVFAKGVEIRVGLCVYQTMPNPAAATRATPM